MAEAARDLGNDLRKIRDTCKAAANRETGKVDVNIIAEQGQALKKWMADFRVEYTNRSISRSTKSPQILSEGKKVLDEAWFCFQMLQDVELQAGAAEPTLRTWEPHAAGVVLATSVDQMFEEMDKLLTNYLEYKRSVLGI